MSYRESFTGETFDQWSARIVETVRELEAVAAYGELASYPVAPSAWTGPQCNAADVLGGRRIAGNLYSDASADPFAIPADGNDR